ncbi:SDR family NAD(P)-dependent oxidoreductase [Bradyrhizobium sp.]|uniref:SDR family NAD(P)-dependent oxidoreductase n=1 Tax=Bradyrhizobium sp. TaxID=376 RepID=UPI00391CF9DF
MAKQLEGKVAAVTGAASGIGLASSEAMLAAGARVVMVDRDATALAALAERHGDAVIPLVIDLLDAEVSTHSWSFPRALRAIAAADSGVLVLLNCGETAVQLLDKFADQQALAGGAATVRRAAKMDLRTYGVGAQILRDLAVGKMKLLARPRKMPSMAGFGLQTTGYLEG